MSHPIDHEIQVASYDVLVYNKEIVSRDGGDPGGFCLALFQPQKTHIGNNRYQVFINMYKSEFEQAKHAEDDVVPIINRIVDIVNAGYALGSESGRRSGT